MTALLGLLGSAWPYIASGAVAVLGLLYAFVKGKNADTKVAQAGQQVAQANQATAQANTQTAQERVADAQATATAALAAADSVKERANVENDVASLPAGAAADQLHNDWTAGGIPTPAAGSADQDKDH